MRPSRPHSLSNSVELSLHNGETELHLTILDERRLCGSSPRRNIPQDDPAPPRPGLQNRMTELNSIAGALEPPPRAPSSDSAPRRPPAHTTTVAQQVSIPAANNILRPRFERKQRHELHMRDPLYRLLCKFLANKVPPELVESILLRFGGYQFRLQHPFAAAVAAAEAFQRRAALSDLLAEHRGLGERTDLGLFLLDLMAQRERHPPEMVLVEPSQQGTGIIGWSDFLDVLMFDNH